MSKPSPNNNPTGYMCHGLVTALVAPLMNRVTKPRLSSCASSSASSNPPRRIRRNTETIPTSTTRLSTPIRTRNTPEITVPATPVTCCSSDDSSSSCPASERTPSASSATSTNTTEEWPSENQKPIETGRPPSASCLRVVLSMAAMWSGSKACRMPRV